MRSKTWQAIYQAIEQKRWQVEQKRGMKYGASNGIAVMSDPLAREWQRLEDINKRVGCHFFAQLDKERRS